MSNKPPKGSSKHKRKAGRSSITVKDIQIPQTSPHTFQRKSMTESPVTPSEDTLRYRAVVPEIRRSLIVGAITLTILFVLYFLLR